MHQQSKELQLQYEGFLKTPFLWKQKGVFDLYQFDVISSKITTFSTEIIKRPRLGKLVERFVSFELQQNPLLKILAENIQIQQEKITLGELDCLLLKNEKPIHLEIIYKFYLYDNSINSEIRNKENKEEKLEQKIQEKKELERWIGPNKKDSLVQKLTKLKEKQLPLLYSKQCNNYLNTLNLKAQNIEQQLYFKAQLFVPLKKYGKEFPIINNDCIIGFYVTLSELDQFKDCKFHIPEKHNWLIVPHQNIDWLNFNDFIINLQQFLNEERAPLCWLKKTNGELIKIFVIWW